MAKFIELEDWNWLNIDKVEQIFDTTAEGAEKCE